MGGSVPAKKRSDYLSKTKYSHYAHYIQHVVIKHNVGIIITTLISLNYDHDQSQNEYLVEKCDK